MARSFNATPFYENTTTPVTGAPLTLAAWIFVPSANSARAILSIGDTAADNCIELYAVPGGGNLLALCRQAGSENNSQISWSNDAWQHCCGVFASTTSRTVYRNGTAGTTDTNSNTPASLDRIRIASRANSAGGQAFDGIIAEAAIWSAALNVSEVAALVKGYSPLLIRTSNLEAYWPLIGRTTTEPDIVGGYAMTPNGTPTVSPHTRIIMPSSQRMRRLRAPTVPLQFVGFMGTSGV
jgi:hypothetical protein